MVKQDKVRRDNRNRQLRIGESQRKDGKYLFKYSVSGKIYFLTSWRLLPSDRQPKGTKSTLSLRELEKQQGRDLGTCRQINLQEMTVSELVARYLPNITPHICRHTYCSNMARSGMNPKTLQYLMGHSDIGVTMNTYTHLGLDAAKEEIDKLERARKELEKEKVVELPATKARFRIA